MLETAEKPRLRLLLDHFALIEDDRESWRVAYPLPEVLLLVVCGTIASGDDFEDIDGKTSRGSHDRRRGRAALHLVSAFATRERLVIGQEAVAEGSCEQDTIPLLLERLARTKALDGALVTIDAIACNPKVANAVVDAGADYLIAVKANQPGLFTEIERFFNDPLSPLPDRAADIDKGHGRVEQRSVAVSTHVDWMKGQRRFPGAYRLPGIAAIIRVETETFEKGNTSRSRRFYVSSRAMPAAQAATAIRAHWAIETSLHWVLDVTFKEDKARGRTGNGPANMAVLRHFAFNLIRSVEDRRSMKLRRKRAARNNQYLTQILQPLPG